MRRVVATEWIKWWYAVCKSQFASKAHIGGCGRTVDGWAMRWMLSASIDSIRLLHMQILMMRCRKYMSNMYKV